MRAIVLVLSLLVGFAAASPVAAQQTLDPAALTAFANRTGLRDVAGFVATVEALRNSHQLPSRYVTKRAAEAHGWHGGGLCADWPGHAIGGDVFRDAGAPLPRAPQRLYREADLDESCASRGPKRLIFSNDGLIFVTVDHYLSFVRLD
jgi:ribonuclease T1